MSPDERYWRKGLCPFSFLIATDRLFFHLEHLEKEVGVRSVRCKDFLAETGAGHLEAFDRVFVQDKFHGFIRQAGEEKHNDA